MYVVVMEVRHRLGRRAAVNVLPSRPAQVIVGRAVGPVRRHAHELEPSPKAIPYGEYAFSTRVARGTRRVVPRAVT